MKYILILISSVLYLAACSASDQNKFTEKGVHKLSAKKGTIITFSLPQNKSTGYELCWINENKVSNKFKLENIQSKLIDPNNVDGGGQTIQYQFLVQSNGIDTIKFKNCPTSLWQKDCSFFAVDSIRNKENGNIISTYAPNQNGDYDIVISVN